jgi:hypothetical protein
MTLLSWKGALLGETPRPTGRVTRPVALSATRDSFKPALPTKDVGAFQSKIQNPKSPKPIPIADNCGEIYQFRDLWR